MEALIQQHQEENNRIKYELTAAKEHSKFTLEAEKKIGKLKEQKAGLKKEVSFLHEKGMHLQVIELEFELELELSHLQTAFQKLEYEDFQFNKKLPPSYRGIWGTLNRLG